MTARPVTVEATASLVLAAHATTRNAAIRHLLDAVSHGLPAADAMAALGEWDKDNAVRRIGGAS